MTKDELVYRLKEHGLARYQDRFEEIAQNCIRLHLERHEEDDIAIGSSKMGGRPDLPPTIAWPFETTRPSHPRDAKWQVKERPLLPLSFLAQINLSEIARYDPSRSLPERGTLYFFYSADQDVWGYDPRDRSGFHVAYFEGETSALVRSEFPDDLPHDSRFSCSVIRPRTELSLPWEVDFLIGDEEYDAYYRFIYEDSGVNQMLGQPAEIQGEMRLECELVSTGGYAGDPEGYKAVTPEMRLRAETWLLLMQIDSNEKECGMMWGDVGRLYYWIRTDDLRNEHFDKSWMILQCS